MKAPLPRCQFAVMLAGRGCRKPARYGADLVDGLPLWCRTHKDEGDKLNRRRRPK